MSDGDPASPLAAGAAIDRREALRQAAAVLARGGLVAYPTEGCYGIGCDPRNAFAVRRILHIKRRHWRQGLILIGAHWAHIAPWVDSADAAALARARATWPGPHTWLLPARRGVSRRLRGEHDSIAVRITAHPMAAALCRTFGAAIVSTSANRHGQPPARSAAAVRRGLGDRIDGTLCGPLGGLGAPTSIRDARSGRTLRSA